MSLRSLSKAILSGDNDDISQSVSDLLSLSDGDLVTMWSSERDHFESAYESICKLLVQSHSSLASPKICEDICRWIFEMSIRNSIEVKRIAQSFLPALIYAYLVTQSSSTLTPVAGVEAALLALYNGSLAHHLANSTAPWASFRVPSINVSSIYHDADVKVPVKPITQSTLKTLEKLPVSKANLDMLRPLTEVHRSNVDAVIGVSLRSFTQNIPFIFDPAYTHMCRSISSLLSGGISTNKDELYKSPKNRITFPRGSLVQLVELFSFGIHNSALHGDIQPMSEQVIRSIHQRAMEDLNSTLMLATTSVINKF